MDYKKAVKKFISQDNKPLPTGFVVLSKDKPYVNTNTNTNRTPSLIKKRGKLDINGCYESLREESIKSLLSEKIQLICEEFIEDNQYFDNPILLKNLFTHTWNLLEKNIKMKITVLKEEQTEDLDYSSDHDDFY